MAANNTLFPETRTPEQIARYKVIYATLDRYRLGTATMKEVLAIPKDELQEARDWVGSVTFTLLEADIPEIWDGTHG